MVFILDVVYEIVGYLDFKSAVAMSHVSRQFHEFLEVVVKDGKNYIISMPYGHGADEEMLERLRFMDYDVVKRYSGHVLHSLTCAMGEYNPRQGCMSHVSHGYATQCLDAVRVGGWAPGWRSIHVNRMHVRNANVMLCGHREGNARNFVINHLIFYGDDRRREIAYGVSMVGAEMRIHRLDVVGSLCIGHKTGVEMVIDVLNVVSFGSVDEWFDIFEPYIEIHAYVGDLVIKGVKQEVNKKIHLTITLETFNDIDVQDDGSLPYNVSMGVGSLVATWTM